MDEPLIEIVPDDVAPPFGAYSHGVAIPAGRRLVLTSGQLGMTRAGEVPADPGAQVGLCFAAIGAVLRDAGGGPADVVRLLAFVTDRAHFAPYMAARDRWLAGTGRRPASTLVIVGGFTRPEFLVEVEATAAVPA